jgi:uncharacterized coiled-coil DUF342 family protein
MMPNSRKSSDQTRKRIDRAHEQAQELIAESHWLRLKSRELLERIRRERDDWARFHR